MSSMSLSGIRRAAVESVSGLPRQFWWLWTSTLINRLGAFVATFLALYLTVERGYSASYAGLIGALYGLGGVVSSIGAGVLADRLGRRPTLLTAQLLTAGSVAALGFVEHPVAIAVLAGLVGMATNGSRPAVQAMMADIVPPADRVRAFALNYWAINIGFAVSSTAAGLMAQYSYRFLFIGEAVMVLVCAIVVFVRLPESRPAAPPADTAEAGRGTGKVSMGTVLRDGRFMAVVGLSLAMALMIQQAFVALPVSMGMEGFSSTEFGLVIAVNGLLIVLVQLPLTRLIERRDPASLLAFSALLTGFGFGLHAFAGSVAFYVIAVCVWTVGEVINAPTQMGIVVRLSPTHGRGRYQGTYVLSWSVAALAAPLLGGLVIDRFGPDTLWAICALLGVLTAVGYRVLLRGLPEDPAEENPAEEGASPQDAAAPELALEVAPELVAPELAAPSPVREGPPPRTDPADPADALT